MRAFGVARSLTCLRSESRDKTEMNFGKQIILGKQKTVCALKHTCVQVVSQRNGEKSINWSLILVPRALSVNYHIRHTV